MYNIVLIITDTFRYDNMFGRTGKSNISEKDERYWPIYPEIGHVPFLLAGPNIPKGKSLPIFAQPMDFIPTICELAKVEVNPPEPFHGKSFASIVLSGSGNHRDFVVSGCHLRTQKAGSIPSKATVPFVLNSKWGYAPVGASGKPELYDIERDPLAELDIAKDNESIVQEMHQLLIDHLRDNNSPDEALKCWGRDPRLNADGSWAIDY